MVSRIIFGVHEVKLFHWYRIASAKSLRGLWVFSLQIFQKKLSFWNLVNMKKKLPDNIEYRVETWANHKWSMEPLARDPNVAHGTSAATKNISKSMMRSHINTNFGITGTPRCSWIACTLIYDNNITGKHPVNLLRIEKDALKVVPRTPDFRRKT